uniref:Uncharacterized protein n=1 Tax=Capra hircus TaxID=9925 RepID=A0A8C2R822_CAPHI
MPVPLPPQHSKRETRESQSSVVPSDHEPSEKKDEKYQAKISPSSPQGPLKKRSAFEDLTNAPILEYYSGYRISDLHALVRQLNILLTFHSCNRLKTVCSKYSHE